MSVVAARRAADSERLRAFAAAHPAALQILQTEGNPPHRYLLRFVCRGVESLPGGRPRLRATHDVQIVLPTAYPIARPTATVLTPVCNPHIFESGTVCLGDAAWSPAESLDLFVQRLRSILVWDPLILDPGSPANWTAMRWAEAHRRDLPLDEPSFGGAAPAAPATIDWR
ncbi:MAG TPA: ubiquitin-conjugating enzyme E2 [Thermomicrobiales bacterium]|nr:ubiquitin-conjugating enzyme E2 [Thermomicrobiales bacterium]